MLHSVAYDVCGTCFLHYALGIGTAPASIPEDTLVDNEDSGDSDASAISATSSELRWHSELAAQEDLDDAIADLAEDSGDSDASDIGASSSELRAAGRQGE